MPYALLVFGLVLFVAGIRGKHNDLFALVKGDFTGNGNFIYWLVAIAVIGGAGYIKPLKPVSIAFMSLLLIVLLLSNKGVIPKLQSYLNSTTAATSGTSTTPTAATGSLPSLAPLTTITNNLGSIP